MRRRRTCFVVVVAAVVVAVVVFGELGWRRMWRFSQIFFLLRCKVLGTVGGIFEQSDDCQGKI